MGFLFIGERLRPPGIIKKTVISKVTLHRIYFLLEISSFGSGPAGDDDLWYHHTLGMLFWSSGPCHV